MANDFLLDHNIPRLVRLAPRGFALTIVLSFAAGLLIIAQAWMLSLIIDGKFLRGATLQALLPLFGMLIAVIICRAALQFGSEVAANDVAIRVKTDLRNALFDKLTTLGPAFTRGEQTGELASTAVQGIEALDPYFSQYLPQLIIAALVPLSIVLIVFPIDILSAIILLITAPLIPLFMILIGNAAEGLTRRQFSLLSRTSAHFLDTLQGLTTLKTLNRSKEAGESVRSVGEHYASATLEVLRVAFLSALVLEMVATISTAVVAVQVGLRLLYGQLQFQPAILILILAPEFYLPLRMLGLRFHSAASGTAAANRILKLLSLPAQTPSLPAVTTRVSIRETLLPPSFASSRPPPFISVRSIERVYDDRPALLGVTFDIRAGQTVALFGPSGAGKSTLVDLILRFIDPSAGEILIEGVPLSSISPDLWRERIAWVPQRPHLFHDTIAANIALGRPGATIQEVARAARAAHLETFVESLPAGYESIVGEEGARLSAGQAQRLALARAFLRDSSFLILDEPTSNVDPSLEAELEESTKRLMQGRTVLLIAHRFSTIYRADRIVVLDQGRVVQMGSHSDLIQSDGLYRHLALPIT